MGDQLTEPIDSHEDDFTSTPPPAWPKWIGGLAIAWGGLMLTCTGLLTAYIAFLPKLVEPLLEGAPMPEGMILGVLDWALAGLGFALTLVLLFGGIFCVSRKPIGRMMILIWGIATIPVSLFNYVRQIEAQESIQAWTQQYPESPLAQEISKGEGASQIIGLVLTIVLGILVPAFFVIWFGFIKTKPEHFTGSDDDLL